MRKLIYCTKLLTLMACKESTEQNSDKKSHPSHKYHYVDVQQKEMNYLETLYVPVYSDIYYLNGTLRYLLTATVSIRNNTMTDTAYVFSSTYYDSDGAKLKEFVDSTILVLPLESFELVVEQTEIQGGAGANFIIEWGAKRYTNQLMVQSIMIGTTGQHGISFFPEAKVINQQNKKE
jgi:hypothetical protein